YRLLLSAVRTREQAYDHRVQRERAQKVTAHSLLDLREGAGGAVDPVDVESLSHAFKLGLEIDVADERRCSGKDEQQVLNQSAQGAQQVQCLFLAFGACAVRLGGAEELRVIRLTQGGAQHDERVFAAGQILCQVETQRAADRAFRQPSHQ